MPPPLPSRRRGSCTQRRLNACSPHSLVHPSLRLPTPLRCARRPFSTVAVGQLVYVTIVASLELLSTVAGGFVGDARGGVASGNASGGVEGGAGRWVGGRK